MNLREEIKNLISNLTDRDTLPYKEITDEILKLFEQKVESIKNENTPKILEHTLMDSNEKALFTGYHKALEDLKQELQKDIEK